MADPTLIVGLAGIAGTLFAGAMAQGVAWRVEAQRQRAARQREIRDILRAVRVVDEEMAWTLWSIRASVRRRRWWPSVHGPKIAAWEAHSPGIAGDLSPETWKALAQSIQLVRRVMVMRPELDEDVIAEMKLGDGLVALFGDTAEALAEARILLRPFNLDGSSFVEGRFWFPAVPEVGPWELWSKRERRAFEKRETRHDAKIDEEVERDEPREMIP